ncbi:hypothetical protein C8J56DRAFT_1057692 [Mycena floridula]|nr:hypothetical protein C8J56DRAFT_1057692 [Mycena floridula]
MLSLADLLNPAETVSAPASTSSPWLQQTVIPPGVTVKHNVKLNRDTTLTELWIYPPGFLLEYPHTTGQGIKVCPFVDPALSNERHSAATRDSLKLYLQAESYATNSPARDVLEKALYVTFHDTGCPFPVQYETYYSPQEQEELDKVKMSPRKAKRGQHKELQGRCEGRIVVDYTKNGRLFLSRCQHYSPTSRKHLVNYEAGNGLYHTEYLTALIFGDEDYIQQNVVSQKLNCPHAHRGTDSRMIMAEMVHKPCESKVTVYEPITSSLCNQILVVCRGIHDHPPPLPTKTPSCLRASLLSFLYSFKHHLADLTPRRLLRTPATRIYLSTQLPEIHDATFVDLHPSLGNLDHLGTYIKQAQAYCYPEGLGWKGLMHLKKVEEATLDPSFHYIRCMKEMTWPQTVTGDFEEIEPNMEVTKSHVFKLVLCMFPQRSFDLLDAQYVQSDISHKRIAGYKEFVWIGFNRETQNIMPYCRVFINSSSAEAHKIIFDVIREQVQADTGKLIQYRHIHSESLGVRKGILHWAMDQDGAQAKGLGLHLQQIAHSEAGSKSDLHQPWRTLGDLGPYEHVNHLIRMCIAHFFRNIHKSKASEVTKVKMRSLSCVSHSNLPSVISELERESKVTRDWIQNKLQSKFAIQGLCHQESFIPLDIWQAGDNTTNIVEASHRDINRKGVGCSLVGGTVSGKGYDLAKLKVQENHVETGISSSYRPGHVQQSVNRSVHRRIKHQTQSLDREDKAIAKQNVILLKALQAYQAASDDLDTATERMAPTTIESKVQKLNKALERLQAARDTSLEMWKAKKGSGDVEILLE